MKYTCEHPLLAASLGLNSEGKNILKFYGFRADENIQMLRDKFGQDNVFLLPCGSCEQCRRNYAENWSIRCVMESKCHSDNYFITLTYDDRFLPKNESLAIRDVKKFIDRLEGKRHKNKFKYFYCLEQGETTQRFHFHMVIFGDQPYDLYSPTLINTNYHFKSKFLESKWPFGFVDITPFESNCAAYVAKYTTKNGSIHMSRNIGRQYVMEHFEEIAGDGFKIYGKFNNGKTAVNLPPCFIPLYLDKYNLEVLDYRKKVKLLSHLRECYELRDLQAYHPEELINNKNTQFKDKVFRRRLEL